MSSVDDVVAALREGGLAVLPTDTVYGLTCAAGSEAAARELYRLKGRDAIQPTAVVFASVEALLAELPQGLSVRMLLDELLPGPYTLVVPNARRRFAWLNAERPQAAGVRVPALPSPADEIVGRVGAVVATSANLPGEPDPCRVDDVPERIRRGVAAVVDAGALPGTPSTVIDVSGPEPTLLRAGAGAPDAALARAAELLG
jgi:L-threonylcarbamoyladenylate synthase